MRVSRATIFFSVLVSIFLFVPYVRAAEIDFRRVTAAKADVLLHPKNADAWQNLSDAYYQIIDAHRDLSLSDLTVDWRNAEHRALELRYGSLTNPRTVQEALELATIFSNQWQGPCQGMRQCYDETEPGFYRALVASLKQKTWDLTSPAESQAATELNRHYGAWQHDRPDLFPAVDDHPLIVAKMDLSNADASTGTSSLSNDNQILPAYLSIQKKWVFLGGGFVAILIILFAWLALKKI